MTGPRGRAVAVAGLTLMDETPETLRKICTGLCVGAQPLGTAFSQTRLAHSEIAVEEAW